MVGIRIKSNEQYDKKLEQVNPHIIRLGNYVKCNKHLLHKCTVCDHEWQVLPTQISNRKQKCPECYRRVNNKNTRLTLKEYNKQLKDIGSTLRARSYINTRTPVEHFCIVCKNVFVKGPDRNKTNKAKCLYCSYPARFDKSKRSKSYRFDGRIIRLMGYEKHAVRYLLYRGVPKQDILFGKNVPSVKYNNGNNIHFPDMYIKSKNILIEVKSTWTLLGSRIRWEKQVAKYKAAIKLGFKYKLLVFSKSGKNIKIPVDWYKRNRVQMIRMLRLGYD